MCTHIQAVVKEKSGKTVRATQVVELSEMNKQLITLIEDAKS